MSFFSDLVIDHDLQFDPNPVLDPNLDPAEFADYDGNERADNEPEDLMDPDLDPAEFAYVDADDQVTAEMEDWMCWCRQ